MTGLDAAQPDRLTRAQARWRVAEDKLFPVALVDPDSYRRSLGILSYLLEELRATTTVLEQLLDVDADPAALLATLPAPAPGGEKDRLLVEAALAVRSRELTGLAERDRRTAVIAAARSAGTSWVDLDGSWEAVQRVGSRHTEMHLATGRALVATVDPYSGEGPYRIEELALDPDSGTPVAAARERAFADRAQWQAQRERWRAEIGSRSDEHEVGGT